MTIHQTINGRAGEGLDASACRTPNKGSPETADLPYAYVENGEIHVLNGGRYQVWSRAQATHEIAALERSPAPVVQERVRQIRSALIDSHNAYFFRAPRFGDLVVCPYCDADTFTCDHCGGERRLYASEVFSGQCDSPQPPLIGGRGGKPRSPVESRQFTTASPMPGSSRSAASPTESGSKGRSCPPASGGSRARSTPKPASFSPLKSCGPKSTGAAPTLGANGHG